MGQFETNHPPEPEYSRRERTTKLSFTTKLSQGIGAIPGDVSGFVFSAFVLLYYNQVLGVDARLVSVALGAGLLVDAITDPLVATYSDNLKSRWGRRHPLMLVGAIPLGFCIYGVFMPPETFSDGLKALWLFGCSISVGLFTTLFVVPWNAIAAELSDDYHERTSIMSHRFAVGWFVGVMFPLFIFTFVMPGTDEQPIGQLNPAGYPTMALWAALLASSAALATTLLTWREIPYLRQPLNKPVRIGVVVVLQETGRALKNKQFSLIFVIVLLASAIGGTLVSVDIYMSTFFWGFGTEELRWFSLSAVGALLAFPFVDYIQRRWDKKQIMWYCAIASLVDGLLWVNLRLLGVLPENGDATLLVILVGAGVFTTFVAVIDGIIGASLIADILDQHELKTGYRQEAMFNAALSFSDKVVASFGIAMSGFIVAMIQLPENAKPADVPAEVLFNFGLIVGVLIPLLYVIPIYLIRYYNITQDVHRQIQLELAAKRKKNL
ncbi:MAG: hypothetical protein GXP16_05775 [Gammaproteobacteria bacterium]|nr:hypothetical protein [Gammaproteobacteria bacterium]